MNKFKEYYDIILREISFNNFDVTNLNNYFINIKIKNCLYKNNFCKILINEELFDLWKENDRYVVIISNKDKRDLYDIIIKYEDTNNLEIKLSNLIDSFENIEEL